MTNAEPLRFFITSDFLRRRFDLRIGRPSASNPEMIEEVQPVVLVKKPACEIPNGPALGLTLIEAQSLMDELWRAGIRPAEGAGSAGQAAATEKHLQDMRALAFHALKAPKP